MSTYLFTLRTPPGYSIPPPRSAARSSWQLEFDARGLDMVGTRRD
jgi:hypothetical protein